MNESNQSQGAQPRDDERYDPDESWRRREHLHRCPTCYAYKDCDGSKQSPCMKPSRIICESHDGRFLTHGEAALKIGVTKNTLFRWEKAGLIAPPMRDRNNHRLFTYEMIEQIRAFKNQEMQPCGQTK